jgi:3-phenylpropionate/trans-cinnamate dioxygenase ferredoxin reductase subunit
MSRQRVVIVGASLAGASTAVALRKMGFAGEVLLLGDEQHLPYERPELTKGYLAGRLDADALLVHPTGTYADMDIDVRCGWTATGLDATRRRVVLADGADVPYDMLVIATGSVNVRPPIPGMRRAGVHQLRRIEDADRLAAHARSAGSIVIIGMGFIGCEVAATLRQLGAEVTMVDRLPGPLAGVLGPDLSARVRAWHEERGVGLVPGVQVAALEGHDEVEAVRLSGGRLLPADLVVVGVGVRPATDWLADTPLSLLRGAVPVDPQGRTSIPQVYAAGDVTAVWDGSRGVHRHVEHYRSAIDQAATVAHAVLDQPSPRRDPSWFWSEQYEHVLHLAGDLADGRAHVRENPFAILVTRDETLTGVATIDGGRDFRRALRLLGHRVDLARLTDPGTDLRTLAIDSGAPRPAADGDHASAPPSDPGDTP